MDAPSVLWLGEVDLTPSSTSHGMSVTDDVAMRRAAVTASRQAGDGASDPATVRELTRTAGILERLGRVQEAVEALAQAATCAAGAGRRQLLIRRARLLSLTEPARASDTWRTLGREAREGGDDELLAACCFHLASVSSTGRSELLAQGAGLDSGTSPWALQCRARIAFLAAAYEESLSLQEASAALARADEDHALEALATERAAHCVAYLGDLGTSAQLSRQAIALAEEAGDRTTVAIGGINLGFTLLDDLRTAEALAAMQWTAELVTRHGLVGPRGFCEVGNGLALEASGKLQESHERLTATAAAGLLTPDDLVSCLILIVRTSAQMGPPDVAAAEALAAATQAGAISASLAWEASYALALTSALDDGSAAGLEACTRTVSDIDEPESLARVLLTRERLALWTGAEAPAAESASDPGQAAPTGLAEAFRSELAAVQARDIEALNEVIRTWEQAGRRLDAACAQLSRGVVSAMARNPRAEEFLLQAHSSLVGCGAFRLAEFAASWLERQAGRPRSGPTLLLDRLSDTQADRLLSRMSTLRLPRGATLYSAREEVTSLYLVRSGAVALQRENEAGKRLTVAIVGPGGLLGESAFTRQPSDTTAEALDDCELSVVHLSEFEALCEACPQLACNLGRQLAERLTRVRGLATAVAFDDVEHRLASLILQLDQELGHPRLDGLRIVRIPLTQTQLAEMMGASRKAVTLALNDFRRRGMLDLERKRIVIREPETLAQLASG